jgi:UTP--glucose-1-phosphate uridylyltransferase
MPAPHRRIRKAVLPVAGLGTRVLPATKAVPKEMLAVFDRPAIQYVVEEAVAAGIEHIVFVTGRNKGAIEDHFDRAYELEDTLKMKNRTQILAELEAALPAPGAMSFVRQQAPLGLGHAVWCARDVIGDEPFALLLPDMIMLGRKGGLNCLPAMVALHNELGGNVIGVSPCDPDFAHNYGIVAKGQARSSGFDITGMVEKPPKGTAPSNLFINGRYLLSPAIFELLSAQEPGAGGEIQLTDSMHRLMEREPFFGFEFAGRVYDCGDKIGFLRAVAALGLANPEFAGKARQALVEELKLADEDA